MSTISEEDLNSFGFNLDDFEEEEPEIPLLGKQEMQKQQFILMNQSAKAKFNNKESNFNINFIKQLYFKNNQNYDDLKSEDENSFELPLQNAFSGFSIPQNPLVTFIFVSHGEEYESRIKFHFTEKNASYAVHPKNWNKFLAFFNFEDQSLKPNNLAQFLSLFNIAIYGWENKISFKKFYQEVVSVWPVVYKKLSQNQNQDPFDILQQFSAPISFKPKTISKPKAKAKAKAAPKKTKTKKNNLVKTIVKTGNGTKVTYQEALKSVPIEEMLKFINRKSNIVEDISDSEDDIVSSDSENEFSNKKGKGKNQVKGKNQHKCPFYKDCENFVDVKAHSIALPTPHDNVRICKDCWASPRTDYQLFDFRCLSKNNKFKCRNCNQSLKNNEMVIRDGEKKCKSCLYKFLNKKHIL